jgi:hypothetical protein
MTRGKSSSGLGSPDKFGEKICDEFLLFVRKIHAKFLVEESERKISFVRLGRGGLDVTMVREEMGCTGVAWI